VRARIGWLGLTIVLASCRGAAPPERSGTIAVAEALGGASLEGFARAEGPRSLVFPADHGSHPEFRTEWWYQTGNLATANGRRFGYELTFFRTALAAAPPARTSALAAHQVWMAHLAVTDVADSAFHAFERFARGAAGLAGATTAPLRLWVDDWQILAAGDDLLPLRLTARAGDVAIDLTLDPGKPIVLHGDGGFSRKTANAESASFYYSVTRAPTRGRIAIGPDEHELSGVSWIDHEWSTSVLSQRLVGWDWLALQLDDDTELMHFRVRHGDGTIDHQGGTEVDASGTARRLTDVDLEVTERWPSPRGGAIYPAAWRLRSPRAALDLELRPVLADQELMLGVRYWEGAVEVRGTRAGRAVVGVGYVELTGYAERPTQAAGRPRP